MIIFILAIIVLFAFLIWGFPSKCKSNFQSIYSKDNPEICNFLITQGFDTVPIQRMCRQYSKICGDGSNKGFVYNTLQNMISGVSDEQFNMEHQYKIALMNAPPNEGGYCYEA
ncbi:MAG TPA: hypothetical protein PKD85_00870 [Saprospiraceae bacterium]|nr:hypothetical protein [Saprospiraceae bacterium]